MNAQKLFEITVENQITVDALLHNCESTAKIGGTHIIYPNYIAMETIAELLNKGFKVSKSKGMKGEDIHVISWV